MSAITGCLDAGAGVTGAVGRVSHWVTRIDPDMRLAAYYPPLRDFADMLEHLSSTLARTGDMAADTFRSSPESEASAASGELGLAADRASKAGDAVGTGAGWFQRDLREARLKPERNPARLSRAPAEAVQALARLADTLTGARGPVENVDYLQRLSRSQMTAAHDLALALARLADTLTGAYTQIPPSARRTVSPAGQLRSAGSLMKESCRHANAARRLLDDEYRRRIHWGELW